MKDLKEHKILVTGASSGIGKAIAKLLLQNGAEVAIHYNRNRKGAEDFLESFEKAKIFQADLAKEHQVAELFEAVVTALKRIDTIILNAAIFRPHVMEDTADDWYKVWKETMAVNLNAAALLTRLGIDHYKKQGGGRFIYIGSRAASRGETKEYLAYAASKGGLTSLSRSVARSFGKDNIKSFVVAPGFTRTAMAEQFIAQYGEERVLEEIALNELTKPEDIAPLIALMSSGQMDHATGATIDMNAGSHIR